MPSLLAAVAVFFVPGALFGWAARLRGLALVALAPALTGTLAAGGAIVFQIIGVRWSWAAVAVLTLALSAVAWGVRMLLERRWRSPQLPVFHWSLSGWTVMSAVLAATVLGWQLKTVFGTPDSISQTFDNIFHLNAVRYIEETGSASSLTVGQMAGSPFYPAAWHALASLVVELAQTSIPVAVSSVTIVAGAAVWPLGCIFLTRQVLGRTPAAALGAAALSAAFGAFPLLLVDFGVLYPNMLSIAMLPAALALVAQCLHLSASRETSLPVAWLLLAAIAPGITLSHPSSLMALLAFSWPLLIFAAVRLVYHRWQAQRSRWTTLAATAAVLALWGAVSVVLWRTVRPVAEAAFWPPVQSQAQAVGQVLLGAPLGQRPAWGVAALAVVGLAVLARSRRWWWVIGCYLVGAFLFVAVSSTDRIPGREFWTGVWYNDSYRLAALLPVVIIPAAAAGLAFTAQSVASLTRRLAPLDRTDPLWSRLRFLERSSPALAFDSVGLLAVLVALAVTQQVNVREAIANAHGNYVQTPDSPVLSLDEDRLLDRLDADVPEGSLIAGNPWTGTSLAYALADRRTLQLHVLTSDAQEVGIINGRLRDAGTDPAVCPAVRELGVSFVLDFGTKEVHNGHHEYPGLSDLQERGVAQVVDQEGEARLLKITACG